MTRTEQILSQFLTLTIGASLAGCDSVMPKTYPIEDATYCMGVEEGASCPPIEEVNKKMPYEPACELGHYIKVTAFKSQSKDAYNSNPTLAYPPDDEKGDTCCYQAKYQQLRDTPNCVHGRPYMQEDNVIVAQLEQRPGLWKAPMQAIVHPNQEEREIAGQFYLAAAQAEHASIASFNRFALELISFGAPPNLIQRAQEAAIDEIRHAQSAFSIANSLLEQQPQPANMPMDVQLATNIQDLASAVLEEAAIQETLAVLLAAEQRKIVQSPDIKRFLDDVIRDESRHAELAFETLRWCIEVGGEEIRSLIAQRIQQPIKISTQNYPKQAIAALGLPNQEALQRMVQRGISEVIIPALLSVITTPKTPLA